MKFGKLVAAGALFVVVGWPTNALASKKVSLTTPKVVTAQTKTLSGKTTKQAKVTVKHGKTVIGKATASKKGKYTVKLKKMQPKWKLSVSSSKKKYRTYTKKLTVAGKVPVKLEAYLQKGSLNGMYLPKKSQVKVYNGKKYLGKYKAVDSYSAQSYGIAQDYVGGKTFYDSCGVGALISYKITNPKYSDATASQHLYYFNTYGIESYVQYHPATSSYYDIASHKQVNSVSYSKTAVRYPFTENAAEQNPNDQYNVSYQEDGVTYAFTRFYDGNESTNGIVGIKTTSGGTLQENISKHLLVPTDGSVIYYDSQRFSLVTPQIADYYRMTNYVQYKPATGTCLLWKKTKGTWNSTQLN